MLYRALGPLLLCVLSASAAGAPAARAPATAALAASAASAPSSGAPRWAQLAEIGFQHLTRDQGLPNAIASSVAQDREGFVWVGTLGGLARWDGYRFRVFAADPRSPGLLPDNVVQSVYADGAGRVWVGTSAAGLLRYDRSRERFEQFTAGAAPGRGPSHVSVRAMLDDGAGGLWVGTEVGLDHMAAGGRFKPHALGDPSPAAASAFGATRTVHALARDKNGALWVASAGGLFKADAVAAGAEPVFKPVLLRPGETEPEPLSVLADGQGALWVGTRRHGLFGIAPGAAPRQVVEGPGPVKAGALMLQQVTSLIESRPGELWLGTRDDGLYVVDTASLAVRRVRQRATLPSSLLDNSVRGLMRDRAGLLWVATNQGLSRFDPGQQAVLNVYGARTDADDGPSAVPLSSPSVSWITVMPNGLLWLATHRNGIDIVDPQGGRVAALRPDFTHPETALPRDLVLTMEPAADGSVFIGTKRGLYRANADGSGVVRLRIGARDPAASTWALRADGQTLWVGGESDGVWRFDLRSGLAQPVGASASGGLTDRRITVLALGQGGRGSEGLWVGTRNGLEYLDTASGRVRRLASGNAPDAGIAAGFITALHHDRQGRLWVGRYGDGIDILPREAARGPIDPAQVRHLGAAQGLADDNINALLEDAEGRVWASTDSGVTFIDPATWAAGSLRRAEGAVFPLYWTGSAARTAQGEMLFGGAGGLTVVRPGQVRPWAYRPQVLVSDLRIGGQRVPVPANGAALQVQPDANSLSIEFSSDDYSAPERNRHAYRLEGYDRDWVETDIDHRVAAYTNLPPGKYRLRLRASNRDGLWAERELTLPFVVLPAWHQTLWFRAVLALGLLALVLAVVQLRTRWLRERQAELQAKVRERTAELEQVSRALEDKSRVLEMSSLSDPLTGLRNRRFLTEHIDTVIAASLRRAHDMRPATSGDTDNIFLLVDIDHFKQVNDQQGHAAGDAVLVQFAQRLRLAMRESDLLVRWGGEEFLVVARDTDRSRAEELAERVRADVASAPFTLDDGRALHITCSIGVACMPFIEREARALGWQDVVNLADVALLATKRMGRNGWIALHATEATRADGLMARLQQAPQQVVDQGEIRLGGSRPAGEMLRALGALQGEAV